MRKLGRNLVVLALAIIAGGAIYYSMNSPSDTDLTVARLQESIERLKVATPDGTGVFRRRRDVDQEFQDGRRIGTYFMIGGVVLAGLGFAVALSAPASQPTEQG